MEPVKDDTGMRHRRYADLNLRFVGVWSGDGFLKGLRRPMTDVMFQSAADSGVSSLLALSGCLLGHRRVAVFPLC